MLPSPNTDEYLCCPHIIANVHLQIFLLLTWVSYSKTQNSGREVVSGTTSSTHKLHGERKFWRRTGNTGIIQSSFVVKPTFSVCSLYQGCRWKIKCLAEVTTQLIAAYFCVRILLAVFCIFVYIYFYVFLKIFLTVFKFCFLKLH